MAKLTAPLLSLGASGQIANTLVTFNWKGLNCVRKYVIPSNPSTAAQVDQRDAMTAIVSVWRNTFTNTLMRTAWNRLALLLPSVMSGFNAFTRNAVQVYNGDNDASFAQSAAAIAANKVEFVMKNLDDGATGDEAGNFEIWVGDAASSLLLSESVAIAGGKVTGTVDLGTAGDVKYLKLRKGGFDRSGIVQITLID
jgi:hypothetical protein